MIRPSIATPGEFMAHTAGAPAALSLIALCAASAAGADAFRQLDVELPTPNVYRTASGAPGPQYWQQRADYDIQVELDEQARRVRGTQTITYTNRSPDTLRYLWLQLDQNRHRDDSIARRSEAAQPGGAPHAVTGARDSLPYGALRRHQAFQDREYGFEIGRIAGERGQALTFTVVDTTLRIDLPRPLKPGESMRFSVDWAFNVIDHAAIGGRNGYEHFAESNTYLYFLAQWYPRLVAYTDYAGWQHHHFLGRGEFTLEFGDYDVKITVPDNHIVSASGVLQNPGATLTATQRQRLERARGADAPLFIVTPGEALANEKTTSTGMRTWHFRAENVRDFAWSSSTKFIWDAMGYNQDAFKGEFDAPFVMAMSFYPNEAEPLWSRYSTQAVVHTMEVYSRYAFPYPYPTSQSVNTWARGGMEYPMITFNGYRPAIDDETGERTYSAATKYGAIGVIIHEIGHNYFPMIVNSDERQWTWMDEGINSFLQTLAQYEWDEKYPYNRGGKPHAGVLEYIPEYMVSADQVPIMTQSDAVLQFGPNAYAKPTAAYTILRETIMGRELFDHALREYSRRWRFRRPTPADFFRTLEDASGVDLDWFWRGWFYTTDHVDVAVADVREYQVSSQDPDRELALRREEDRARTPEPLTPQRNRAEDRPTRLERIPELADFYNEHDPYTPTNKARNDYRKFRKDLEDWERAVLDRAVEAGEYVYFVDFENRGGLVMPLPLEMTYEDGSTEFLMIPAQFWRLDSRAGTKMLIRPRRIVSVSLDPRHEIADADYGNNHYPGRIERSRLELYRQKQEDRNLMKEMMMELEGGKGGDGGEEKAVPLAPAGRR
jgi:hypothetical protein